MGKEPSHRSHPLRGNAAPGAPAPSGRMLERLGSRLSTPGLIPILLGYPQFNRANAIKPLAWGRLHPYGLARWESELCDSDLV